MTDIIKKKKYIIESSKNKKLYSISHEKTEKQKKFKKWCCFKSKDERTTLVAKKELVKLETLSELDWYENYTHCLWFLMKNWWWIYDAAWTFTLCDKSHHT